MLQSQDPTAKLVHLGEQDPQTGSYDEVVFEYQVDKPAIRVMGVPPEEMRLDRYARSFSTSRIVGHERIVPIDELTRMGYDREQCLDYLQSQEIDNFTMESQLRNPGRSMSTGVGDGVLYGEWYIKVDRDGDGIAELRYICTMGEDHKIVHDKEANRVKFAVFGCDPISHTIVGDSLADYVQDVQKFKTNMMRGVLDSLAESINPKSAINELVVDMDDAQNDDVGGIIRVRGNPGDALRCLRLLIQEVQPRPVLEIADDRINCTDCVRHDSTGRCGGWKELGASSDYHPVLEPLRRCEAFIPMPHLKDQRTGKQRWPGLQRIPAVRMISATTMKKKRRKLRIDQCSCHVCERRRARGEDV
jgi:hypothetical protein